MTNIYFLLVSKSCIMFKSSYTGIYSCRHKGGVLAVRLSWILHNYAIRHLLYRNTSIMALISQISGVGTPYRPTRVRPCTRLGTWWHRPLAGYNSRNNAKTWIRTLLLPKFFTWWISFCEIEPEKIYVLWTSNKVLVRIKDF